MESTGTGEKLCVLVRYSQTHLKQRVGLMVLTLIPHLEAVVHRREWFWKL